MVTDHGVRIRGNPLTLEEATAERTAGRDVVVCGDNLRTNCQLAEKIECAATDRHFKFDFAHTNRGTRALPHFQSLDRKRGGHTFFESPPHKLVVNGERN